MCRSLAHPQFVNLCLFSTFITLSSAWSQRRFMWWSTSGNLQPFDAITGVGSGGLRIRVHQI
jgi:hypothetical protein